MLEVKNLTAGYGHVIVIRDISFKIEPGEVLTIIGANGAGKTTLLWALSGLIVPTSGKVLFDGLDITGLDSTKIVRSGISHGLQGMQVFGEMTVENNLMLALYGQKVNMRTARAERLSEAYRCFPVLETKRRQLASSLSGGEKKMLVMARALMTKPKLLLLDEPSTGLAPLLVKHLFEVLGILRKELSLATLLVEQNAEIALDFADKGLVLTHGEIALQGDAKELLQKKEVKEIYLGGQISDFADVRLNKSEK